MAKRGGRSDDERQLSLGFDLGEGRPVEPSPPKAPAARPTPERRHDLYFALVPDQILSRSLILPAGRAYLRASGLTASVRSEDVLHLSLVAVGRYDGEVPEDDVARARQAAGAVKLPPFRIVFDRITGWKGGRNPPVVLLTGEGAEGIADLCEAIAAALQDASIRPVGWSAANPHLTLAYAPERGPEQPIEPIAWTVRDFVLIKNWYGRGQHEHLGRWPLAGR
jgi:2'-5' RNA ligase